MDKLAIYDIDYTVISNNSLASFLAFLIQKRPYRALFLPFLVFFSLFWILGIIRTKKIKEIFLMILCGMPQKDLEDLSREFFEKKIKPHIKPGAAENIRLNKKDGFRIVFASASFEFYIKPLAEYLKADNCIGTKIVFKNEKVCPKISGKNCKGKEKINRILGEIPAKNIDIANSISFSDSRSDLPFLDLSSRFFKISRKKWKIKKIYFKPDASCS